MLTAKFTHKFNFRVPTIRKGDLSVLDFTISGIRSVKHLSEVLATTTVPDNTDLEVQLATGCEANWQRDYSNGFVEKYESDAAKKATEEALVKIRAKVDALLKEDEKQANQEFPTRLEV